MRTLRFGKNLLMESSDFSNGYSNDYLEKHMFALAKCFTRRSLFRELVKSYHNFSDLDGIALLKAHGNTDANSWRLVDGERWSYMQNLVDSLDGHFSAIFLYSCNPGNRGRVHSKSSIVIHPSRTFYLVEVARRNFFRLYFPGEGYVENDVQRMKTLIDEMNHSWSV